MGIFGNKTEKSFQGQFAKELLLEKEFAFMYENFIISDQRELFLLLEMQNEVLDILKFNFKVYKFGYPNDEVGLPSKIPGVINYGVSEVFNSKWIQEIIDNNSSHSRHSNSLFSDYRHFVIRFKDDTLEVIADKFELITMTKTELTEFVSNQISFLDNDR